MRILNHELTLHGCGAAVHRIDVVWKMSRGPLGLEVILVKPGFLKHRSEQQDLKCQGFVGEVHSQGRWKGGGGTVAKREEM